MLSGNSYGTIKLWNVNKNFYQYKEEDLNKFEKMFTSRNQQNYR